MSSTHGIGQREIVDWFDSVYLRKGHRYLRPIEAYYVFLELLGARPHDKLLDVACGLGLLLQAASEYTKQLYGIDVSRVAASATRKRVPDAAVYVANAERLPFPNGTFDLVTCLGSLERMIDRRAALGEMRRVGSDAARYCFLVRNSNTSSWKYLARVAGRQRAASHADADTLQNWMALFEAAGYRITAILPDQYPLHRRRQWGSLFMAPADFRKPISTALPIERANEFIFVLEKES